MNAPNLAYGRAFGGGDLPLGPIVRHAYLDEAGISENGEEPVVVVAAALTDPDRHWHEIANYYDTLADGWLQGRYFAQTDGHFVFHAKDVWHGAGEWGRNRFSLQDRMAIFKQLAQAPDLLAIPICIGVVEKSQLPREFRNITDSKLRKSLYLGSAFVMAMQSIDDWMERHCPGRVCMMTAEDTDSTKAAIRATVRNVQTDGQGYSHEYQVEFRSRSIVDTPNFAPKNLSPIMQMADHCAFIVRRAFTDCQHIGQYMDMIRPAIHLPPSGSLRNFRVFGRADR
jgi:hypothetical protein